MKAAQNAARADDDDRLWRCLRETMRFRNFNLGPFRMCGPGGYTLAAGTSRATHFAAGTGILASTQSAMFDRRRIAKPRHFDPKRAAEDYLMFGLRPALVSGASIAAAQITQTFKALLRKPA